MRRLTIAASPQSQLSLRRGRSVGCLRFDPTPQGVGLVVQPRPATGAFREKSPRVYWTSSRRSSIENPFSAAIQENIPGKKAWVALGWRHFMYWFADAEFRLGTVSISADELIAVADGNWAAIETMKPPLLMEERQNDGSWVRQWFRALVEFPYFV